MTTKSDQAELTEALSRVKGLEAEVSRMESFMQAHDALTRMVLNGQGMAAITARFGELIQHCVQVEDRFHNLLATYTLPDRADESHLARVVAFQSSGASETAFDAFRLEKALEPTYNRVSREHSYGIAEPQPDLGLTRRRLIAPVMVENEGLGYLILLDRRGGFSSRVIQALEHAALIYALLMMKEKSEAETERRLRADFVEDLIGPRAGLDEAALLRRGHYLGFNRAAAYLFVVADLDDFAGAIERLDWDESTVRSFIRQFYQEMSRAVRQVAPDSLLVSKSDSVIMLIALARDREESDQTRAALSAIRHSLARLFADPAGGLSVSIGVGGVCRSREDFPVAAQRANRCLELLKTLGRQGQTVNYADLGLYGLLLDHHNKQPLFDFADARLNSLLEYDRAHGTALVETLQTYFAHSMRLKETALACHIHLSALKYRLRRLQEIGGFSLSDPEACFNLQLALKISEIDRIFPSAQLK